MLKTRSGIRNFRCFKRHQPDIWLMQEVNVSTELQSVIQTSNCNILPENGNSRGTAIVWT